MTREEAVDIFDGLASLAEASADFKVTVCNLPRDVFVELAKALHPQPDPATGLLPCGCGGIPEFIEDKTEPKFGIYTVMCSKCNIRLSGYTNRIDFLKIDWNRAMGYRDA